MSEKPSVKALATTMLCLATAHVSILLAASVIHRDPSGLNLFALIEAHRLWPELGNAPWWSLGFGLLLYIGILAELVQRRAGSAWGHRVLGFAYEFVSTLTRPISRPAVARVEAVARPIVFGREWPAPSIGLAPVRITLGIGTLVLVGGLAMHMTALAAISQLVREFPRVPDVLQASLPYVDFGVPGELVYAAFMLTMSVVLWRTQRRTVPAILVLLGLFYGLRGFFLFLLPIGMPPTAPPLSERFVLWPYAGHAYFPGGHAGMMTVLSLSVIHRRWRWAFLAVTFAFAVGTVIARTHYAADALGGWLLGYAIVLWGRHRFGDLAGGIPAGDGTSGRIA